MSLVDLTSKCFQNGVPAKKWVGLCRLLKKQTPSSDFEFESNLCNSILIIFPPNPGDLSLQAYIEAALLDGLLTLRVFTAVFLQAAKSPNLQEASTLDNLCRLILSHHFASGLSPNASFMRGSDSATDMMAVVHDSLSLLRVSSQIPSSPYHSLTTSAGQLSLLLIHCIGDLSQVSNQQIVMSYATILDIFNSTRLDADVRNGLENLVVSLGLLINEDVKLTQEVQVMQTMQVSLGRTDASTSSTSSDLASCSFLLRHLVEYRTSLYGAGNTSGAVALLIGYFRWSAWTAQVYYTQLLQAAVSCLAQGSPHQYTSHVWSSFIVSRLPTLLGQLEKALSSSSDSTQDSDWKKALQAALLTVKNRSDLLSQLDVNTSRTGSDEMELDVTKTPTAPMFFRTFLKAFVDNGSVDKEFAQRIEPDILSSPLPSLKSEAAENGQDVNAFIDAKLSAETSFDDALAFLERTLDDVTNHALISSTIKNRFDSLCSGKQDATSVEGLSIMCKLLNTCDLALDIIALQVKITDLVAAALHFVDNFECELVGDPQTAVGHLGTVILFLQSTMVRYQLASFQFTYARRTLKADYLLSTSAVFRRNEFNPEEANAYIGWVKALFDSNSEGIDDSILRTTKPKTLLKLAATLIHTAFRFHVERKIDVEVLNNGISYFTGDLLNWTLVGVIKSLLQEIMQKDAISPLYYDILQNLVEASSCPKPVLCLTGHGILAVLADRKTSQVQTPNFKPTVLRDAVTKALGNVPEEPPESVASPLSLTPQTTSYLEQPRQAIRDAFSAARAGKAPSLDISRGVLILGPAKYLRVLWAELLAALQLGSDMDLCRRIATHALTCPPINLGYSHVPPLLPIFLHGGGGSGMLQALLKALEHQLPAEQTLNVELLVSVLTSSLTAVLQMEWALALRTGNVADAVVEAKHPPMGQTSVMLARRLNADLKRSTCTSAATILQRLSSTASFVANFPIMAV